MIVSLGSVRGAPGVTSWSLLLAAAWPGEFTGRRVVLEADPAGGVLGARYGWGVEPGAVRLVTGLRRNGASSLDVPGVARDLGGGVWVVPGPESGDQARAVWSEGASATAGQLAGDDGVWLVDVGRVDDASPSAVYVDRSVLVVLVTGPYQEDLVQLPARVASLRARCGPVSVLVSGRCSFTPTEIGEFCGAEVVWVVPCRDDLVDEVGRLLGGVRARRSWLWRHALDVAADAYGLVASRVAGVVA